MPPFVRRALHASPIDEKSILGEQLCGACREDKLIVGLVNGTLASGSQEEKGDYTSDFVISCRAERFKSYIYWIAFYSRHPAILHLSCPSSIQFRHRFS